MKRTRLSALLFTMTFLLAYAFTSEQWIAFVSPASLPTATPLPPLTPTPRPPTPTPAATPTPGAAEINIVAVGDVMLGRMVNVTSLENEDFRWPFLEIAPVLRNADLTLGNLESPLVYNCPPEEGRMVFCGDARAVEGLVWAGFDGMSLANNHRLDYYEQGHRETIAILEEAGVTPFIHEQVMFTEVEGVRIGVIGFDDVLQWMYPQTYIPLVEETAAEVDVLLAVIHWGYEYHDEPSERQVRIGRELIDAGVDVVIGAHPHWVQPVVEYKRKLIFYSLGNFVFDQTWSEETTHGELLQLSLTVLEGEVSEMDYTLVPVTIHGYGQPALTVENGEGEE